MKLVLLDFTKQYQLKIFTSGSHGFKLPSLVRCVPISEMLKYERCKHLRTD